MSDESSVIPVDDRVVPLPLPGPGDQLRAARLHQGLEIADVARQLKLFPRQVEAMERDDYAALPSRVFVRGFIRNYARVLGLDPLPLLTMAGVAVEASTDGTPAVIAPPKPDPVAAVAVTPREDMVVPESLATTEPVGKRGWVIGAVVVTVALLVGYMLLRQSSSAPNASVVALNLPQAAGVVTGPVAAPSAMPAAAAPGEPPAVEPVANPPLASSPAAEPATPAAPATQAVPVAPVQTTVEVPAASAAEPATGPAVRMAFTRDAWVEIRDRRGAVVFSELSPAGAKRVVRGTPPFSLVIGNASGVAIAFDGRDIDLGPYTRSDVAHLVLE